MSETLVLGIETSCDETAAAVVSRAADGTGVIRSNIVLSQMEAHRAFGGVVPEIAARAHVEALDNVVRAALHNAGAQWRSLDAIAVTAGPGLIGGLIVGTVTAKAIAAAHGLSLIPINHLEGHALTARLTDGLAFPYLLFLMSGGHTQLVWVAGVGAYRRLGSTVDDALGEAFDKTAKLLGLGFPGGPAVEAAAAAGDPTRFVLPRPLAGTTGCDFSFSGLKTAVRQAASQSAPLAPADIADISAGFQAAVADVLADRVSNAIAMAPEGATALVAAGGVAANRAIRSRLAALASSAGLPFVAPPAALCTDNAAMIAWAGAERIAAGLLPSGDFTPRPRWPLDEAAAPLYGAGAKGPKA